MNFFQSFRRPKEGPEDLARGLLRLVTERKQLAVMSILVSDQIKDAPKLISDCAEASGEPSFLHFVLKTNPPVEMVEMILVSMDDCESSREGHPCMLLLNTDAKATSLKSY